MIWQCPRWIWCRSVHEFLNTANSFGAPPKTEEKSAVNHQHLSRGLTDLAQICYMDWSHHTRTITHVQGQGVKGQGHGVTQWGKIAQLENVAIANALQLEAARRRAVPIRFNFVARAKFEVAQPIRCRLRTFLLLIRYVTLWPWTLTPWPWSSNLDLEHLQCAGCAMVKLCTKVERNRAIRSGVIAIWIFDLVTLNM